ncbi:Hypothetical predicted protein [Mytilus galloprovincialis]|nr:Hypothetical predicted protein [Mytilus galloprovincialis]
MENTNAQGDILEKIRQSIIAGHRCFTNDDVDCNSILVDLRQAQRSLDVLGLPDDSKRNIGATVMALVDQIEMKIQRDRAPSNTKAYSASRHRHAGAFCSCQIDHRDLQTPSWGSAHLFMNTINMVFV